MAKKPHPPIPEKKPLGPTDRPRHITKGTPLALRQGKRFVETPVNEMYDKEGEKSIPAYIRKKKHVDGVEEKERKLVDDNFEDATIRKRSLRYAANNRTSIRGKKLDQEAAIAANERIKDRDKLHGPGYKKGGKVTPKVKPKGKPKK